MEITINFLQNIFLIGMILIILIFSRSEFLRFKKEEKHAEENNYYRVEEGSVLYNKIKCGKLLFYNKNEHIPKCCGDSTNIFAITPRVYVCKDCYDSYIEMAKE